MSECKLNYLTECSKCLKNDVCKHRFNLFDYSVLEDKMDEIRNTTPFEVTMTFKCKAFVGRE